METQRFHEIQADAEAAVNESLSNSSVVNPVRGSNRVQQQDRCGSTVLPLHLFRFYLFFLIVFEVFL